MFTCKDCLPKESKWLVDLAMGVSYGPCENCGKTTKCIDCSGSLKEKDNLIESSDTDNYK